MQLLRQTKSLIKFRQWWDSKIPPLLAFAYLFILQREMDFITALVHLGLLMVWLIGAAGFGHYLNDCFDIKQDHVAGKINSAAQHSPAKRLLSLSILLLVVFTPWVINPASTPTLALVALQLVLFLLYSAPPFRLKERGLAGIFADALYAHAVPTLIVIFAFSTPRGISPGKEDYLFFAACFIWSFVWGIRNIIAHQLSDFESDITSGTKTFAGKIGTNNSQTLLKFLLIPLEIISFFTLCWIKIPVAIVVFAGFLLYKFLLYSLVWKINPRANLPGTLNSFFSNFYEQWFPVLLLVMLVVQNQVFTLLLLAHLFLFTQFVINLREQFKSIFRLQ